MLQQAVSDPADFVSKASRRLGVGRTRLIAASREKSIRALEIQGEFSEALATLNDPERSLIQRLLSIGSGSRLRAKIRVLETEIESVPKAEFPEDSPRVLYIVGNSLPFTNSGYSKRGHSIALAARRARIDIAVQTRLGYPMVVGIPTYSVEDRIDEIDYHRAVPWIYRWNDERRLDDAVAAVVKLARELKSSVLHTTTGFPNAIVVSRAAKKLDIPWVYEVRGELEKTWLSQTTPVGINRSEDSEFYKRWRRQETNAAVAANRVAVLSEISKNQLIDRGVEAQKIHVVPNATEDELLGISFNSEQVRESLGLATGYWVGSVTSIVDYEGLETLLESLCHLPLSVKALLVGDGQAKQGLVEFAKTIGVEDRVLFAGKKSQQEAIEWYKALDVFVIPRRDVPVCRTVTPIKPLAAMALGIPVIATDLPALREVTGDCAEYVIPGDPKSLAEAILRVKDGKYDRFGARTWVASRTWEQTGQQLLNLYTF